MLPSTRTGSRVSYRRNRMGRNSTRTGRHNATTGPRASYRKRYWRAEGIMRQSIVSAAVAAALFGFSAGAHAGGFAIGTQSGSGTGNAFAGGAAAEDASTVWYNPAGMSYLPAGRNVAIVGHALKPSFKFSNSGSTGAYAAAGTGEGGDGGD